MSLSEECKKYVSKIKKLAKEPKAKKLNGYNLFLKEKSTGLEGTAHKRMTKIGKMWTKCSDDKKEAWNAKAEKLNKKAAKEFEEEGEELDEQVKELNNFIEETIANFKKNLKNPKCKKVDKSVSELKKCNVIESPINNLIGSIGKFEMSHNFDQKRLKALQDIMVEWCVKYT